MNLCHRLEQGSNKQSGRCSLLTPDLPPAEGKKGENGDLQIEYYTSFINNVNNINKINNKINKKKHHKTYTDFPKAARHGRWHPASSCQTAPRSPGLDSAADRNWTQECTDCNLDQDCRQNKQQGPLQKLDVNEESETLMIPQL